MVFFGIISVEGDLSMTSPTTDFPRWYDVDGMAVRVEVDSATDEVFATNLFTGGSVLLGRALFDGTRIDEAEAKRLVVAWEASE